MNPLTQMATYKNAGFTDIDADDSHWKMWTSFLETTDLAFRRTGDPLIDGSPFLAKF